MMKYYFLSSLFSFIISVMMMCMSFYMLMNYKSIFLNWILLNLNGVNMEFFIYLDWITFMFIFLVTLIYSMIMIYCIEYMSMENLKIRFFFLVMLFVISMIFMIISPNIVSIILGWDGLGLVSYLLVIYYQSVFSFNSGMLTVLMNRVGDVMIMLSIAMFFSFGSWNFFLINKVNYMILFFVIVASFTKSAQFPFSSWLPAAMAAPTPVSSLVHSSTLVTAGVYLLIRFNYLIYKYENLKMMILIIGGLTMFIAGMSAVFEYDLKKIIAFSTLSQLGLMMMIFSMKFFYITFFHLVIHGMFKSLMFMCSGVMIHSLNNMQDIRFMGNLIEFLPFTIFMFLMSNFSLCGMPFFSGFFSKDMILEKIFMSKFFLVIYMILLVSTLLTVIYSFRLFCYLMLKNFNFLSLNLINDSKIMNYSMIILLALSIIYGMILNWLIFLNIEEIYLLKGEKILLLLIIMFSLFMSNFMINLYYKNYYFYNYYFGKMSFLNYMNMFYNKIFLKILIKFNFLVDKGMNEFMINQVIYKSMESLNFLKFNNIMLNKIFLLMSIYLMIMILIF